MKKKLPAELEYFRKSLREIQFPKLPPCIYFLLKGDQVIYVGQSSSLYSRLSNHRLTPKDFDRVFVITVPEEWVGRIDKIEASFIRFLDPPLNRTKRIGLWEAKTYLSIFGLPPGWVRRDK